MCCPRARCAVCAPSAPAAAVSRPPPPSRARRRRPASTVVVFCPPLSSSAPLPPSLLAVAIFAPAPHAAIYAPQHRLRIPVPMGHLLCNTAVCAPPCHLHMSWGLLAPRTVVFTPPCRLAPRSAVCVLSTPRQLVLACPLRHHPPLLAPLLASLACALAGPPFGAPLHTLCHAVARPLACCSPPYPPSRALARARSRLLTCYCAPSHALSHVSSLAVCAHLQFKQWTTTAE
ncbi:hypothetical protein DENSPDRAFT_887248 [Dentipellis sp. KUC8613]|nr:hypothetical protein DENSPDRAFT_226033 [Dentipellis sp. KUC8613]KAA1479981.1 hypothetical protein DENSPDRAFT_887248 [Dentipellis sp. KUC8613]